MFNRHMEFKVIVFEDSELIIGPHPEEIINHDGFDIRKIQDNNIRKKSIEAVCFALRNLANYIEGLPCDTSYMSEGCEYSDEFLRNKEVK